jgi:hypothetical protein
VITFSILVKSRKFFVRAWKSRNICMGATRRNFSKWLKNYKNSFWTKIILIWYESLDWNEKCPGDLNKIIAKVKNFKWFLRFKRKETKKEDLLIFWYVVVMLLMKSSEKKLGKTSTARGTLLGNSKNLIKILKKSKIHQKRWKTKKILFLSKTQQMTFKISITWK